MIDRRPYADVLFEHNAASAAFEELLVSVGAGECTDHHGDGYDDSLELHGCPNDMSLSTKAVLAIMGEGFCKIYLNHENGDTTLYERSVIDRNAWTVNRWPVRETKP